MIKKIENFSTEELKAKEQEQLRDITQLGLKLFIRHDVRKTPIGVNMTEIFKYAIGNKVKVITWASLINKKVWDESTNRRELESNAVGVALCSSKDQYSKRRGRVIATARALDRHYKR